MCVHAGGGQGNPSESNANLNNITPINPIFVQLWVDTVSDVLIHLFSGVNVLMTCDTHTVHEVGKDPVSEPYFLIM